MTPDGWARATLGTVASFVNGDRGKNYPARSEFVERGIPFVNAGHIQNGKVDLSEMNYITEQIFDRLGSGKIEANDILFCIRGSLGKAALGDRVVPGAIASSLVIIRPSLRASAKYLYYVLTGPFGKALIRELDSGSAQPNISATNLQNAEISVPPPKEQKAIAAILSSVDEAIEATQAVIDQLQVVKNAMMAELLTRGLPGKHTRFKQTDIGELPEDWQVVELGSVLATIDAGWSPQCETRPAAPEEWGVLKLSAVTSGVYIDSEQKALPKALAPRPDVEVRAGDVLLARASGVLELVGRTVLVRATRPRLMLSDKVLRLRPAASRLHGEFLTLAMATEAVGSRLLSTTGGSHMRNVSQSALRVLKLPLPSPDEQAQISATIGSVDLRTESEVEALATLRDFKAALMSVLLTGEVRVKPDEDAA